MLPVNAGRPVLVAVGLLTHGRDDRGEPRYVVTRRHEAAAHLPGCWELPGGKVGPEETPAAALVRELREELGVEVSPPEPLTFSWHAYAERTVLLLFFAAQTRPDSPAPRPLASAELRLVSRDELLELPLPPANRPLLDRLRS
ncbi:MAG: (deoxy)nucleoside triphosphate pyrophosphohydrolase [Myxococcales bacterium]|nr:(deoxy)nucleoside triphosphate pyrophosphohydrolase [Myxococcales bacterium]